MQAQNGLFHLIIPRIVVEERVENKIILKDLKHS